MSFVLALLGAFCGMVYELSVAQSLAALWGSTALKYALTIGVFLFAMGGGALMFAHAGERSRVRFFWVELGLAFFGTLLPFLCLRISEATWLGALQPFCFLAFALAIGWGVGAELPLLFQITSGEKATPRILTADYLGMVLAGATFPLLWLPLAGLFASCAGAGALNAFAALLTLVWVLKPSERRWPQTVALGLVGFTSLALLAYSLRTPDL